MRDKLKEIMDNPPLEPDAEHPLPSFEPHITLASVPVSVSEATLKGAIPEVKEPLRIDFESVEAQQTYFRSAIVNIRKTPQLQQLLASVRRALTVDVKAPSYPHMSLYYVDDARAADRQRALDNLFQSGHLSPSSDGLTIKFAPKDKSNYNTSSGFVADAIWIVLCEGSVGDWKVLYKMNLVSIA